MSNHSLKEWVATTRYWSFPVSTMPVLVTFAYLFGKGLVPSGILPWVILLMSLLGVVTLHAAGNLLSDWFDYRSGVDNENAFAVPNLVFKHFEPREYLILSIILFVIGIALGLGVVCMSGTGVLIVGVIGVVLTALYSFLKYHALGDLDIFIVFGILPVLGLAYAITGEWCWDALVLSLPIGVITVSVLHANNTYDIPSDGAAGIRTFAMLLGEKASAILYCIYMVLPFICIGAAVTAGLLTPLALLCILAAVKAFRNFKQAAGYKTNGRESMKGLDFRSSQLQMAFSLLLAAGLFASRWL